MKYIRKNEFRKNNSKEYKGHPAYIFAQVGNEFIFVGITHADITDGIRNIKLEKNPNPADNSPSYMRPFANKKHKANFGKKQKGWSITERDKNKARKLKIK